MKRRQYRQRTSPLLLLVAVAVVGFGAHVRAQLQMGGPALPAAPGRAEAPIDLTGNWVSLVTEDWAYRMLTPAKGDYMSVPINEAGAAIADAWELDRDNAAGEQCRAFGAAAIMRVPTRLQITWEDDFTLKIETDAGRQTRLLHFSTEGRRPLTSLILDRPDGEPTWQGYSVAEWENRGITAGVFARLSRRTEDPEAPAGGTLKVVTTGMRSGYLRANGVPYSEDAVLTEYFDRFTAPRGEEWFVVTTIVDDPTYLNQPYITSSHYRKEPDASKWNPTPCETWAPPEGAKPPLF